jgi:Holliday junction resolvase-like predicted endonuclease
MSWIKNLGNALISCVSKPIDVLCDWASEPLKSRSHDRSESSRAADHNRSMDSMTAQAKSEHELKMGAMQLESELVAKDKILNVDLEVRRVSEIEGAIAQIEEWKKEKEFERMQRTTEAIARYLEQLTKLNVDTINSIGHMQLELKERAQQLVYEKTIQYKELQDVAISDAMRDLERIESQFGDNERAKDILIKATDTKMSNIIDTANRFLEELNRDIVNLNESIDRLTVQGQRFIENHLEKFHITNNSPASISSNKEEQLLKSEKNIN